MLSSSMHDRTVSTGHDDQRSGALADGPPTSPRASQIPARDRVRVEGKFFFVGDEKLHLRGVTYGPFASRAPGDDGYQPAIVERDFADMVANGINAVRLYTVPERWLLDAAQRHGLYVLVGIAWEQHVAFLDQRGGAASIEARVRAGVRTCASHPAVLAFAVGNEIPARIVRWHGARRIERFLEGLCCAVREEDPEALVTYINYPSTEYLRIRTVDFLAFNVYLERMDRFDAYLARLQSLAGDRPLVMAEIGLDSQRHGEQVQASLISGQVASTFARGAAGAFVFAWTDDWSRGDVDITDWSFGLTSRTREPRPSLGAVKQAFANVPFSSTQDWPSISVVLCSFNGERTITDCLDGLARLDYPAHEVIVVDDGSTDSTADIAAGYGVRLIRTANQGLSAARNEGLRAARGEIVAYIDDDARPDRDWLRHLAWGFMSSDHAGIGGPNIPPHGHGTLADLIAHAPGGPIHVMRSDEEAEHITGCNAAFRAEALRGISGFDPIFRTAGDDVDVCWRLQREGFTLGFSPGAVVWHRRRGSLRAYLRQQRGYGRAEALLERKWPGRYNSLGHISWPGQLYGQETHEPLWSRARRYEGTWGSEAYQSLYQPQTALAWLPLMPEWFLLLAVVALVGLLGLAWQPLLIAVPIVLVGATLSVTFALGYAASASRRARFGGGRADLPVGYLGLLFLLQPLARLLGRLENGLTPWRRRGPRTMVVPRPRQRVMWSQEWQSLETRLRRVEEWLQARGGAVQRGGPFDRWDLESRSGVFASARLLSTSEEHGGGRQQIRFRVWPRLSWSGPALALTFLVLAGTAAGAGAFIPALIGVISAVLVIARIVVDAGTAMGSLLQATGS